MTTQEFAEQYIKLENAKRSLTEQQEPLKQMLIKQLEQSGEKTISFITPDGIVQVTQTDQTLIFNSKLLEKEQPDLYSKYKNQIRAGSKSVKCIFPKGEVQ